MAASLAQIGEFSFILATLGVSLGLLPDDGRDLILAGAIISILLNPFIFAAASRSDPLREREAPEIAGVLAPSAEAERGAGHVVLVGYGRVGRLIGEGLARDDRPFVVIEDQADAAERARGVAMDVVVGNAVNPETLTRAGIADAFGLLVAIPEGFEAGGIVERARALNPDIAIIARAHSDDEVRHLERLGARHVVMGERELAARMLELTGSGEVAPA